MEGVLFQHKKYKENLYKIVPSESILNFKYENIFQMDFERLTNVNR